MYLSKKISAFNAKFDEQRSVISDKINDKLHPKPVRPMTANEVINASTSSSIPARRNVPPPPPSRSSVTRAAVSSVPKTAALSSSTDRAPPPRPPPPPRQSSSVNASVEDIQVRLNALPLRERVEEIRKLKESQNQSSSSSRTASPVPPTISSPRKRAVPPPPPPRPASNDNSREEVYTQSLLRSPPPIPPRLNMPTSDQGILPPAAPQDEAGILPAEPAIEATSGPDLVHGSHEAVPLGEHCLKCQDFSIVDEHARQFPRHDLLSQNTNLSTLAYELCAPFATQNEMARAIFSWLADNIEYDTAAFFASIEGGAALSSRTPQQVFRSGRAVCQGYAELYKHLADHSGVESMVVSGSGRGFGIPEGTRPVFNSNHAWNCVKLDDGQWHLIDACWGAGSIGDNGSRAFTKRFSPVNFTSTNIEFGIKHYPENREFLFREDESYWSYEQFLDSTDAPQLYPPFDEQRYSASLLTPARRTLSPGTHTFTLWHLCEHLDASTRQRDSHLPLLGVDGKFIPFNWYDEGCWSLAHELSNAGDVHIWYLDTVDDRDAKGTSTDEFDSQVMGKKKFTTGGYARYVVI